ncbi:DUF262 domain-containing protein [Chamaesiphon sp. OTE_8_metabat_110]|uniref:DUF262 domain-containing protein n=1 Tax=Chamaesiphon sp. OTE_8_metabat_110 TaxID=2964696 RepID=UPI00286A9DFB|nr:DUF262 domain-containing protein [Chamaesiphon sp. OTE_8_metabat_110]
MNSVKLSEVTISNSDWLIETLVRYFDNDIVSFSPQIDQLAREWDDISKSRFIESLILGFPIQQLVLASSSTERNKFIVIDGRQRLLALSQFYNSDLSLTGLEFWRELEGNTYDSLKSNLYLSDAIFNLDASVLRVSLIRNWQDESLLSDIRSRLKR